MPVTSREWSNNCRVGFISIADCADPNSNQVGCDKVTVPQGSVRTFPCSTVTTTYECQNSTWTCIVDATVPVYNAFNILIGFAPHPLNGTYTKQCAIIIETTTSVPKSCPCDPHPLPPACAGESSVRSKTLKGSEQKGGLKKNNPGCDCCAKRVLIWDVGFYDERTVDGETCHIFNFTDYSILQELLEEEKIAVDHVTGGSPQPWGFYAGNSSFDPYTTAVDNKFWTGNIHDYSLVIFPWPADDSELDAVSQPCPLCTPDQQPQMLTADGVPDHLYWGGVPDWWDEVADGTWSGRILYRSSASNFSFNFDADIGYTTGAFINTLTDLHGMEIDLGAADRSQATGRTPTLTVGLDILKDVTQFPPPGRSQTISGGETVAVTHVDHAIRIDPPFCDRPSAGSTSDSAFPYIQRNIVKKTVPVGSGDAEKMIDVYVEFIISGGRIEPTEDDSEVVRESMKQFYKNLHELEVNAPPE